jgi:hypothetical protein
MMPQMPGMPSSGASVQSDSSLSPFAKDSGVNTSESDVMGLDTPSHEEEKKPETISSQMNDVSQVKAPSVPKKGIEVVAIRKGFYNQTRYKEGDKFFIKSEESFGDWFSCVDPYFEKKRIEFYKSKKAKK